MANEWLRLWHDMPNDPKWRTVARVSGQPVTAVLSVYIHLLVDASRNVTRGHVDVTLEDLASALDVTEDAISSILSAMEGRVIVENSLSGWEKRQPKREDLGDAKSAVKSAAQRQREKRERDEMSRIASECHETSRSVTLDKDKDKDKEINLIAHPSDDAEEVGIVYTKEFSAFWEMYPLKKSKGEAFKAFKKIKAAEYAPVKAGLLKAISSDEWKKNNGQFIRHPAAWLKARGWEDEYTGSAQDPSKPFDMDAFLKGIQA